jgi:hypothetical protein
VAKKSGGKLPTKLNTMSKKSKTDKTVNEATNPACFLGAVMGSDFQVKKIDFSDPEVIAKIEECKRKQQECLDRNNVDWDQLSRTYITI